MEKTEPEQRRNLFGVARGDTMPLLADDVEAMRTSAAVRAITEIIDEPVATEGSQQPDDDPTTEEMEVFDCRTLLRLGANGF